MKHMNSSRQAYLVVKNKYDDAVPVRTQQDKAASDAKGSTCPTCEMAWRTWTDEDGQLYRICVQGHREYFGESY